VDQSLTRGEAAQGSAIMIWGVSRRRLSIGARAGAGSSVKTVGGRVRMRARSCFGAPRNQWFIPEGREGVVTICASCKTRCPIGLTGIEMLGESLKIRRIPESHPVNSASYRGIKRLTLTAQRWPDSAMMAMRSDNSEMPSNRLGRKPRKTCSIGGCLGTALFGPHRRRVWIGMHLF